MYVVDTHVLIADDICKFGVNEAANFIVVMLCADVLTRLMCTLRGRSDVVHTSMCICVYMQIFFCIENVMRNTLAVDSFYFYYYLFLRGGQVS